MSGPQMITPVEPDAVKNMRLHPETGSADVLEYIAALQAAVQTFVLWLDREDARPNYGGLTRDTHPEGNRIWREWYYGNMDLCSEAQARGRAVLEGREP